MKEDDAKCWIWGTPVVEARRHGDAVELNSPRSGGRYIITGSAEPAVSALAPEDKARLTSWLVEQRRQGEPCPTIHTNTLKAARERRPKRASEKFEAFFDYFNRLVPRVGGQIALSGDAVHQNLPMLMAWLECLNDGEAFAVLDLLREQGFVTGDRSVRLTAKGYERLDQLKHSLAGTAQAFVAMWFSPTMTGAYEEGFAPGIQDAGYMPFRIDKKDFNNKVDDEIIAEIRRSRFVVADFTCGRLLQMAPSTQFTGVASTTRQASLRDSESQ
jgi:hypothetical protein